MVVHPNFNGNSMVYDFMMFKIETVSNIQPISLNTDGANPGDGQPLTVIGFGATSEGGSGSKTLLKTTVNAVTSSKCNSLYGGGIDATTMLCAYASGKDSCQGSSSVVSWSTFMHGIRFFSLIMS